MPSKDTQPNQRCLEWLQREATGREKQDRTILCFACLARLPYTWSLSANRTPACTVCTHCLPVAVEGVYYL